MATIYNRETVCEVSMLELLRSIDPTTRMELELMEREKGYEESREQRNYRRREAKRYRNAPYLSR